MLCVVDGVAGGELPGELEPENFGCQQIACYIITIGFDVPMEMMVDILVVELITEREGDPVKKMLHFIMNTSLATRALTRQTHPPV